MNLLQIYQKLYAKFGPQHWWPGDSREEIIIGAILTQSTAWKNVEKAIANLKQNNLINFSRILKTHNAKLAQIIKPAGYHNQKAKKQVSFLKRFAHGINTGKEFKKASERLSKFAKEFEKCHI